MLKIENYIKNVAYLRLYLSIVFNLNDEYSDEDDVFQILYSLVFSVKRKTGHSGENPDLLEQRQDVPRIGIGGRQIDLHPGLGGVEPTADGSQRVQRGNGRSSRHNNGHAPAQNE